jgi:hypothetical protein
MSGDKAEGIKMSKGQQTLHFNKMVRTQNGILYVLILKRQMVKQNAVDVESKTMEQDLMCKEEVAAAVGGNASTINKVHAMCGHMRQVETKEICDYYGQSITKQGFQQCVSCGRAKAKQLAVAQVNDKHIVAGPDGHRVFVVISSVKHRKEKKNLVLKPHWLLFVVKSTNFKISEFLKTKSEMPEVACKAIWKLKQKGVAIKYVRLDNAGKITRLLSWPTAVSGTYNCA